jgi:DNA-binding transcriptional LysR family regulator
MLTGKLELLKLIIFIISILYGNVIGMDIQNLQAFLLVAETGSFSAAAGHLHITQPAVSKRIALLEQELETRLFDRIGRAISLTEAGHALQPHAQRITGELQAAEQSVRDLSGEVSGHLRLATSHHIGLHRLPPVLHRFSRSVPQVHLEIDFMDSEQAYHAVLQGKVEIAVLTLAPTDEPNVIATAVWPDPLDFMLASDHPLAGRSACSLQMLASYPAILPGLNTYTGQIVKNLFDRNQLELDVTMATNYLETLRMLAAVGLGWTVLPRSMLESGLVALPVPAKARIERTLGYIYHRGRSLSRAARAFIAALEAAGDSTLP